MKKNFDNSDKSNVFSTFFNSFCFPYFEEIPTSKELFFELADNISKTADNKTLISILRSSKEDHESFNLLKKLGFSEKNIKFWQENFLNKGFCEK